jgi:hypothetical protein
VSRRFRLGLTGPLPKSRKFGPATTLAGPSGVRDGFPRCAGRSAMRGKPDFAGTSLQLPPLTHPGHSASVLQKRGRRLPKV